MKYKEVRQMELTGKSLRGDQHHTNGQLTLCGRHLQWPAQGLRAPSLSLSPFLSPQLPALPTLKLALTLCSPKTSAWDGILLPKASLYDGCWGY